MNSERVVTPNAHLTLHYRLATDTPDDGSSDLVTTFDHQPATMQLGTGQLSPGIEARLLGLHEGEHVTLRFAPDEGFGPRNPDLVQRVARPAYDKKIDAEGTHAVGDLVDIPGPNGGSFKGVLKELTSEYALFDFNHPLAGRPVIFEVHIVGIL